MKLQFISASDLARNTSAILERILTGETVSVTRNRTEIAHIILETAVEPPETPRTVDW
jgi:antitoxin (DNA-binding transcriptional repressor) of toxin-antitoxin stability system